MVVIISVCGFGAGYCFHSTRFVKQDPQVMAGEWRIEIQHQPCDSVHNLEVIWPKDPDGPISIECNLMPVEAK